VFQRDLVVRAVTDALAVTLGLHNYDELLSVIFLKVLTETLILEMHCAIRRQWEAELGSHLPPEHLPQELPLLLKGLGRKVLMGDLVRHLSAMEDLHTAPMLSDIEAGAPI